MTYAELRTFSRRIQLDAEAGPLGQRDGIALEAWPLVHRVPCFAYVVREEFAQQLGLDLSSGGVPALTLHQMAILRGGLQSPRQDPRS